MKNSRAKKEALSREAPSPRYSFIVPVLNGEKTLAGTLKSILDQNHRDFEVIVVDNGSTDNTGAISKGFPGVRYCFWPKRGRARARNKGAALARGSHLAFVDADVLLLPDWLAQAHRYLQKVPLDALATRVEPEPEREGIVDAYRREFGHWKSQGTFVSVMHTQRPIPLINTAACIVKKISFQQLGGFRTDFPRHEDLELSLRLFSAGFVLGGCSAAHARVRFVAESRRPGAREISYLWRAFEVQYFALPLSGSRFNVELMKFLWNRKAPPALLAYALLTELARKAGGGAKAILSPPPVRERRGFKMNRLACSFLAEDKIYFLRDDTRLLFVDEDVYALRGLRDVQKISARRVKAVQSLVRGALTGRHVNTLRKIDLFREAPL